MIMAGKLESICESSKSNNLDMSVYHPSDSVPTNEEISDFEDSLEQLVASGKVPESEITSNPNKAIQTLGYLKTILDEYYNNPDKYTSLKNYLQSKGMSLKDPKMIGVYDDNPNAVARTNTENTLEANINFESLVKQMQDSYGLSKEAAEEMVLTHELIHLAQSDKIKRGHPQPYIAEIHAELVLTEYFANKSLNSVDELEQEKYQSIANATFSRAQALNIAMRNEYSPFSVLSLQSYEEKASDTYVASILLSTNTRSNNQERSYMGENDLRLIERDINPIIPLFEQSVYNLNNDPINLLDPKELSKENDKKKKEMYSLAA